MFYNKGHCSLLLTSAMVFFIELFLVYSEVTSHDFKIYSVFTFNPKMSFLRYMQLGGNRVMNLQFLVYIPDRSCLVMIMIISFKSIVV